MTKRFCLFLFVVSTTNAFATDQNDSWRGSVRTKLQTDNRYNMEDGDYTGEAWGTLIYNNPNQKFNANFSAISRFSTDIYRDRQQLYQAFAEKSFDFLPVTLRGGRFEKSDNLGLYLVDGATAKYQFSTPLSVEIYGGRPLQVDHVQSLRGNLVGGIEGALNLAPNFSTSWLKIEKTDFRLGMQAVQRNEHFLHDSMQPTLPKTEVKKTDAEFVVETPEESAVNPEFNLLTPTFNESLVTENFDVIETSQLIEATTVENQPATNANFDVLGMPTQTLRKRTLTTYRYNAATHLTGNLLGEKPFEIYVKGSYASEKSRLENVFVDAWWDVFKNVRLRNYYEAYRPVQPYVTFRDRFYSAYALGEQEIWRGSVEHRFSSDLRYSAGLQVADRKTGYDGYGANASVSYQFKPNITWQGTVDYLELNSGEYATSFYASHTHALDSKNRYSVNLAFRDEKKSLYGQNFATGVETEWQTMIRNNWVLSLKGSYINNSQLQNEYLGAVQMTYYFDYFQAKKP
jgi:hypothetical protein